MGLDNSALCQLSAFAAVQSLNTGRLRGLISPRLRKDESAPITVIALSPPVPSYLLGKLKSSTSVLTRSFWRRGGNRLVLVSSAIP